MEKKLDSHSRGKNHSLYTSNMVITVSNNMRHSKFLDDIRVFGQHTENPMFKKNFVGIKYSLLFD